jgi:MFS family permease
MRPNTQKRLISAIIFATILIDFAGFSILIPVLPLFAQELGASETEVGLLLALYSLGLVLFLPVWGWISDRIGRRPVLIICLFGTACSFAYLALAHSLPHLYAARALGGFFGASIGTAQAYMTDITDHDERAGAMGLIGAAFGIGFVLGNLLGGTLQAVHPGLPFYATALLALASCILAALYLPESRAPSHGPIAWRGLGRSLIPAPVLLVVTAHDNRTRLYLYLFFHLFLAFSALEAMFAIYSSEQFGWTEINVGLFMAYLGVVIGVTQGVLIAPLARISGEARLVQIGLALTGLGMIWLPRATGLAGLMATGTAIAFGIGLVFPTFTSLFSKACEPHEAGEALGQSQAMAQTGRTLGAAVAGWFAQTLSHGAPFTLGGLGMLAALVLFVMSRRVLMPRPEAAQAPAAARRGAPLV